jgi:hypothetical protein
LLRAFPQLEGLLSLEQLRVRMKYLSGVKEVNYHCCINSCCCFTGRYELLEKCPFCDQPRYNAKGTPQKIFVYIPLIPRLTNLFLDHEFANNLDYRHNFNHEPGATADIFDGEHYQRLRHTYVTIDGVPLHHKFFEHPTDIALGISTDGFCPFKRRKQTCWPIIAINYNLSPETRFKLKNILCLGVIPGPYQPKDFDSFLLPLIEELLQLAKGVPAFDKRQKHMFLLCVYLIVAFGDMPAVAKIMRMKGHNGFSPCRACTIKGIGNTNSSNHVLYTPLHCSSNQSYNPLTLPLRTHDQFMNQAKHVSDAQNNAEKERRAKQSGIHGVPALSRLSSLSFPISFPHDFMHVIFENIIPMLVSIWTNDFKGMDSGREDYVIQSTVWDAIGLACSMSGDTIPSAFGCRVPNIAKERYCFIAESWLLFTSLLAPVVLRRRFSKQIYFTHFLSLVRLINTCLKMELSTADIKTIRDGFAKWVVDYERYAAQHLKIYHKILNKMKDLLSVL